MLDSERKRLVAEIEELGGVAPDDGGTLLRDLEGFLGRYIIFPTRTLLPIVLWSIATHCFESFQAFPYLAITSPTKRCAKSRLLEMISPVVHNGVPTANISEAALFRIIEKYKPTMLFDEAEPLRGRSERAEYLRGLLNAGNRQGANVIRCVGPNHDVMQFQVYCPKAIAAIGALPETVADRSIAILMQRRRKTDQVGRLLFRKIRPEAQVLQKRAAEWTAAHKAAIELAYETVEVEFLQDREAECWESLFAILAVADPTRLPELETAAGVLTGAKTSTDQDDSLPIRLLADLRKVWPEGEEKMLTTELLELLRGIEDAPWSNEAPLTGRKLAGMLRPFGVGPEDRTIRKNGRTGHGYLREKAEDAFLRYLADIDSQTDTSGTGL